MKEIPVTSPESDALSADLKKRGMSFVGSTIIYAFLQAAGLVDDHLVSCWRKSQVWAEWFSQISISSGKKQTKRKEWNLNFIPFQGQRSNEDNVCRKKTLFILKCFYFENWAVHFLLKNILNISGSLKNFWVRMTHFLQYDLCRIYSAFSTVWKRTVPYDNYQLLDKE